MYTGADHTLICTTGFQLYALKTLYYFFFFEIIIYKKILYGVYDPGRTLAHENHIVNANLNNNNNNNEKKALFPLFTSPPRCSPAAQLPCFMQFDERAYRTNT